MLMLSFDSHQGEQSKFLPYQIQWNADTDVYNCGWDHNHNNGPMGCHMLFLHDSVLKEEKEEETQKEEIKKKEKPMQTSCIIISRKLIQPLELWDFENCAEVNLWTSLSYRKKI